MKFEQYCQNASAKLRKMHSLADELDKHLLQLEEAPNNIEICTAVVSEINQQNSIAEELTFRIIPHIEEEDASIAYAIGLAKDELVKRMWGARQDLEVLMKRPERHATTSVRPGLQHPRLPRLRIATS